MSRFQWSYKEVVNVMSMSLHLGYMFGMLRSKMDKINLVQYLECNSIYLYNQSNFAKQL